MPFSYSFFKEDYQHHMEENFPQDTQILDVGAGSGGYADLLRNYFKHIDGIEIHEPYIHDFNLKSKYNNLFLGDIRTFDFTAYDYIIMGDVLEHLSVEDAKSLIAKIESNKICLMVAVPYLYPQGAAYDNIHETHLQPDLTHHLFLERYPCMTRLFGNDQYGYYINYQA